MDLNEYGESEKIGRHISHKERAQVLDEFREFLNVKQFNLITHDLGSSVAIDYMAKYADHVIKFVIMSPPVYPDFKEPFDVRIARKAIIGPFLVRFFKNLLFKRGIKRGLVNKKNFTI